MNIYTRKALFAALLGGFITCGIGVTHSAYAGPAASHWCMQAADASIPDGAPAGTYSWVPFTAETLVTKGDFGKNGTVTDQRIAGIAENLNGGLEVWMTEMGATSVASMSEASGLVITGEVLYVNAGSPAKRIMTGSGPGKAEVKVLFSVVDAAAPDKPLVSFLIMGVDLDSDVYAVPGILQKSVPKSIMRALKKPSKAKVKKSAQLEVDAVEKERQKQADKQEKLEDKQSK